MKYALLTALIISFCLKAMAKDDITPGPSFCPAAEIETYSLGKQQFMVSNCLAQYRSPGHYVDFKFFDIGIGARYGKGYPPESIGKLIFMNGNFWLQEPLAESGSTSIKSKMQIKYGFTICDFNKLNPYYDDADIGSINADLCYNPNSINDHLNKSEVFYKEGFICKLSPRVGVSMLQIDSTVLREGNQYYYEYVLGLDLRLNFSASYLLKNNYSISTDASIRSINHKNNFDERRLNLQFSKEFFFEYPKEKFQDKHFKDLELYCSVNYWDSQFGKRKFNFYSANIGISFYNYSEYINAYEALKRFN